MFPIVEKIACVRSDDNDLSELVEREGGVVTTPYLEDSLHSFEELNRFCLDLHPEIDGYMKSIYPINDYSNRIIGFNISRRVFTDCNNLCWTVLDSSSMVGRNGKFFSGVDAILLQRNNLPVGVDFVQDSSRLSVMMCSTGIHHFRADLYKKVVF